MASEPKGTSPPYPKRFAHSGGPIPAVVLMIDRNLLEPGSTPSPAVLQRRLLRDGTSFPRPTTVRTSNGPGHR